MSHGIAQRLNAVSPSITLAISARAAEKRAQGIEIFPFGVGEPDFEPPAFVRDAAKVAIDRGASKYTAVSGIAELKRAICDVTRTKRGYAPSPNEVCVTVGAKHALFNLALALFEPGDEIVIPGPYWVSYPEQVRMFGATPTFVTTTEASGFLMSPAQLEGALNKNTKAVVLNSPCNPTGAAYSKDAMARLLDVFARSDAWLIIDEIYADLLYDGLVHGSPRALRPDLADRIIVVDGVSKSYAMTGWRIGWSIAPPSLTKVLDTVQGQSTTNATAVAQYAALAALTGPQDEVSKMRDIFDVRRKKMVSGLSSLPNVRCRMPEGAFYAFADCSGLYGLRHQGGTLTNDTDVAMFFLEEAHVACVPGSGFGAPGYVRFSYATTEDAIDRGIESMRQALSRASAK